VFSEAGSAVWTEAPEVFQRVDSVICFVLSFSALLVLTVVPVLAVV